MKSRRYACVLGFICLCTPPHVWAEAAALGAILLAREEVGGDEGKADNPAAVGQRQSRALIRGSGPEVYFQEGGRRHWIPDERTFDALGFDWKSIQHISDRKLNEMPRGSDYPALTSSIVKGSGPKVFILENGRRRWIPDEHTFQSRGLRWDAVQTLTDGELESIPLGKNLPRVP